MMMKHDEAAIIIGALRCGKNGIGSSWVPEIVRIGLGQSNKI
jgi:hypothetical protein